MALLYILRICRQLCQLLEAWNVRWEATLAQRNEHRCLVHEDAVRAGVYAYYNKNKLFTANLERRQEMYGFD